MPAPTTDEQLPMDIQHWLNVFTPNVREQLRKYFLALHGILERFDGLRTRLDAVEGNVEHMLEASPTANGHAPAQTIEPISLATIVERLERLEHAVERLERGTIPVEVSNIAPTPTRTALAPPAASAASTTNTVPATVADTIRLELLRACRGGDAKFRAVKNRLMATHRLTPGQMAAIWARCQGKFRPDFAGRILRNTPTENRVELRDELARLYGVAVNEVLAWYRARNGNGNGGGDRSTPPPRPTRRIVRRRNAQA